MTQTAPRPAVISTEVEKSHAEAGPSTVGGR